MSKLPSTDARQGAGANSTPRKRKASLSAVEGAIAALPKSFGCPTDERYLIGVSGGRDSMALLHALVRAGYRRLVVCHLDHLLRGPAAQADAHFVAQYAERAELASVIRQLDVPVLARSRKVSLETAAREARKDFFFNVARSRGCRTLFLAHHADDQVETVLFNLCRGTGPTGLAGMLPAGEWQQSKRDDRLAASIRVVRPLLGVWRHEVDAYIQEHHIAFREDATNTDPAHTRNRIRHEIVPALNDVFGREVSRTIWRAADIIGTEENWTRAILQSREEQAASSVQLPLKLLCAAPVAEQRRLLRAWLQARGTVRIGYEELERTRALLDPVNGPAKINLPGGLCVRRRGGVLFIEGMNKAAASP